MKIKSLYISAFGGVKDLKLDFENDFTVIFGENEQGKTTIMNFIKDEMMVVMTDGMKVPVSKRKKEKILEIINNL